MPSDLAKVAKAAPPIVPRFVAGRPASANELRILEWFPCVHEDDLAALYKNRDGFLVVTYHGDDIYEKNPLDTCVYAESLNVARQTAAETRKWHLIDWYDIWGGIRIMRGVLVPFSADATDILSIIVPVMVTFAEGSAENGNRRMLLDTGPLTQLSSCNPR
jgi:hypothetical protein